MTGSTEVGDEKRYNGERESIVAEYFGSVQNALPAMLKVSPTPDEPFGKQPRGALKGSTSGPEGTIFW
jgi:hypothetical protein